MFCGWAIAGLARMGDRIRLRAFTIGTYHEEDAIRYAREGLERDNPGWEITIATYALRGVREVLP